MSSSARLGRLIDLGLTDETPPAEARCVKLVNAIALLGVVASSGSIVVAWFVDLAGVLVIVAGVLVCVGALALNAAGRTIAAQLMICASTIVPTFGQVLNLGLGAGVQYYFVPIIFIPFLVFPRHRVALALGFSLLSGALFAAAAWAGDSLPHTSSDPLYFAFSVSLAAVMSALIGAYARALSLAAEARLVQQRAENEALIREVLPAPIVEQLIDGATSAIEIYDAAVILQADIAGFTPLAESMAPEGLVALLDELVSAFDDVCTRHRVEKLRTVGDAYIAAAGIPDRAPDAADRALTAAREMLGAVRAIRERRQIRLELRIGVACGAVVAGIVGKRRYSLELCGEALDRAEHLQQSGHPGHVVVDDATRLRAHLHRFVAGEDPACSLLAD